MPKDAPTDELTADNDIAIVSVALRVPGAHDAEQFWKNLCDGVESVRQYDEDELIAAGVSPHALTHPQYVRAGAPLDGMELFDAEFFGFSPKEAAIMDPQHRQFLEVAWEALERAGHVPRRFPGAIGVFAGCGMGSYFALNILSQRELVESEGLFLLRHTGNDKDFLATRAAYCLDLRGPSINVQTACSTSLVAVHLACQSLLSGECDMALAGGVTIELPHRHGYVFREREVLSPDGHCRPFDARAQGTVFGSGAGVVALRRLADARDAGDPIVAVIKSSAVNNDGSRKVGYLAPSVDGQVGAISEALSLANVRADSLGLVECHGTGTAMGDPIEIAALTEAFSASAASERTGFCAVGSVKSNIGHLDTAAGVVGLIKAALSLKHKQLPKSLNFEQPNEQIAFDKTPFYVNDRLREWPAPAGRTPRRAGVNSLGVGGTNAYVVLEEAPPEARRAATPTAARTPNLLVLSARNARALAGQQARLLSALRDAADLTLPDVAHSLFHDREHFDLRRVLVARDREEALALLGEENPRQLYTHRAQARPSVVFMFPGGGAQYPRMGAGLLQGDAVFREHVERGLTRVQAQHGLALRELLLPTDADLERARTELERPSLQVPLLFIVEYALAQSWLARGIKPAALIGHSLGENTAACVASVMDFDTTLGLAVLRGRLFESLPAGGMLSVPLPAAELAKLLPPGVVVACENAPELSVASGPRAAIDALQRELEQRDLDVQPIRIQIAAHSPMLEPILAEFEAYLKRAKLTAPQIPIISNLTGTQLTAAEAIDPRYWVKQLRNTVRFAAGIQTLETDSPRIYLEVGPGRALGSLVRQCVSGPQARSERAPISSLRHPDETVDDAAFQLAALGRLWASGVEVDLTTVLPKDARRVRLPTYAFDHQPYFIAAKAAEPRSEDSSARAALEDWFYGPVWQPRELDDSQLDDTPNQTYLLFADEHGLADQLATQLTAAGHRVIFVRKSGAYGQTDVHEYEVAMGAAHSYETLVQELRASEKLPDRIIHFWAVDVSAPLASISRTNGAGTDGHKPGTSWTYAPERRVASFDSVFHLLHALAAEGVSSPMHLTVVTTGARRLLTEPLPHPEKALVQGFCAVIPHEAPQLRVSWVDIPAPQPPRLAGLWRSPRAESRSPIIQSLAREVRALTAGSNVAYRADQRFERELVPTPLTAAVERSLLRDGGVYVITGGLGGIGLALARDLARRHKARLCLVARRTLPARTFWEETIAAPRTELGMARTLQSLLELEKLGAEVELVAADVGDQAQLRWAFDMIKQRWGAVHGVFHAAGVLDDRLLARKTLQEAELVLAPKLLGTAALHELSREFGVELLVLFASTSSWLGAPGQTDYAAANAFLEAYAESRRGQPGPRTIAIQWGVWREVGMAADAARNARAQAGQLHGFFSERKASADGSLALSGEYSAQHAWWLNDHRMRDGTAVMPGTGYLQLMAAAWNSLDRPRPLEIRDAAFLRPLPVHEDSSAHVIVHVRPEADGCYSCEIQSKQPGANHETHASAQLGPLYEATPEALDLAAIRARCTEQQLADPQGLVTAQEQHLRFGPRFRGLRAAYFGHGEALGELALDPSLHDDVQDNPLHAGLLDIGTGFAMPLIADYKPEQGLWAPMSYARLALHAPLPARCRAWVRIRGQAHAAHATASFDVTLCDEHGQVCVEVEALTLRKLADGHSLAVPAVSNATVEETESERPARAWAELSFEQNLALGISTHEGLEVLQRILTGTAPHQVMVSPKNPHALRKALAQNQAAHSQGGTGGTRFARPELSSSYVAPQDPVQEDLAELWQDLLGIERVGIQDDFFELGGHSLTALRLSSVVRQRFEVDLGLSALFDAPTIERLSTLIAPKDVRSGAVPGAPAKPREFTPVVSIKPRGNLPPVFCVAGQGGNPMHLRTLAHYLGEQRPFYGLQHRGLDGVTTPYGSVEEMAGDFVHHIRKVCDGPYLIAGYSGGGTVAFEMARQLRTAGESTQALILLDSFCPLDAEPGVSWRLKAHWDGLRNEGMRYAQRRVTARLREKRRQLEDKVFGHKPVVQQSRSMFETAAANWRNIETRYVPKPLAIDAYLLRVESSTADEARYFERRYTAWNQLITLGVRQLLVPGTHVSMCEEPNVQTLATRLRDVLDPSIDVAAQTAQAAQ